MAKRHNAASRIARLLNLAAAAGPTGVAVEGWSRVFTHPAAHSTLDEVEVARCLAQVRKELEVIRAFLMRDDKDPESYDGILQRAREVFSIRRLAEAWQSVQGHITGELRSGLVLLSQFMLDEEAPLDDDAVHLLDREFQEWEARVTQSALPAHVQTFLRDQIDHVRRAVREYQFRGKAAFEDSAIDAATEWMRAKPDVAPYTDDPVVEGVRSLWPKTEKISRRTILVGGAVTAILAPLHQAIGIAKDLGLLEPGDSDEDPGNPSDAQAEPEPPEPLTDVQPSGPE